MQIRRWTVKVPNGPSAVFECPFFDEFCTENGGALPRDFGAHALFHYYGLALSQYERAKANLVEETELSEVFDRTRAEEIFMSVSKMHNVRPAHMVRFWREVEQQRIAMGGKDHLPEEFKFTHWGH